jgi:hypothetical protein
MMQMMMRMQQMHMQQMQASRLDALVQGVTNKDEEGVKAALEDERPEVRWAAALAVGKRSLPLQEALIARLTDGSPEVRQAARASLIRLSTEAQKSATMQNSQKSMRKVDFGPSPQASRSTQLAAAKKWAEWWAARR